MEETTVKQFIKGVERLVKPSDVTAIAFLNSFTRLLPIGVQKKLMAKTAKTIPHMGFVVEPYSFFLCYPIVDIDAAKRLISDNYKIVKTRIFADDEPNYYIIFGCVTAHTSAFWGTRIEMYVMAENTTTGLLTWVIVDYDTNTNSYDPRHGLVVANSTDSVMTTSFAGKLFVDMKRANGSRRLAAEADITAGTMTPLDQRLWLEGNLSIDYGVHLNDAHTKPFALTFDPDEVKQALRIPLSAVTIEENSWHPGIYASKPTQVACFPYAQHFVTDSYPQETTITDKTKLIAARQALGDLHHLQGFSAKPLKKQLLIGWLISTTISTAILIFLIVHFIVVH